MPEKKFEINVPQMKALGEIGHVIRPESVVEITVTSTGTLLVETRPEFDSKTILEFTVRPGGKWEGTLKSR